MTKIDLRGSGYDSTGYQPTEEVVDDKGQSFQRSSIFSRPKANDSTSLTDRSDSLSGGDANLLQWANEYYLSGGGSGNGVSGYRPDDHESAGDEQGGGPLAYSGGGNGNGPLGYGGGSAGGGGGPLGLGGSSPVVTSTDQEVVEYEVLRGADILTATDSDGIIKKFKFRDKVGGGYFELNGSKLIEGRTHSIKASKLGGLVYRATTSLTKSNPLFNDKIRIKARDDNKNWSMKKDVVFTNVNNWNTPIVYTSNREVSTSDSVPLSTAFTVRDEDLNTIKRYSVQDLNLDPGSGYLTFKGSVVTNRSFKAKNLDKLLFHAADGGAVDSIRVGAFDGQFWGYRDMDITTIARPSLDVVDTQILDELEERPLSEMISQQDTGPAPTSYQIYDSNLGSLSGSIINGIERLEAGVVHTVTAEELRDLNVKGGFYDDRSLDEYYIRMNNGRDWGEWEKLSVRTEPHYITSLEGPAWDEFISRDSRGRLIVTYSFLQKTPDYYENNATETNNFRELNDSMRAGARRALDAWQDVTDITFVEVSDTVGGVIRFGTADLPDEVGAWAYLPGRSNPINQGRPGDVWLNNNGFPGNDPLGPSSWAALSDQRVGSWGHFVLMHELGHAIGLTHPFEPLPKLPAATENTRFSVMSYTSYSGFINDVGGVEEYASTPMLYDIAAMESLYGAQMSNNVGDTVYEYGAGINDAVLQTIYDTGGTDVFDASNQFRGVEIDLAPGGFSSIGYFQRGTIIQGELVPVTTEADNNIGIAFTTKIENAIGSRFSDVINGNNFANDLRGGRGNDELDGLDGDDYLSGQNGNDIYKVTVANGDDMIADEGAGGDRDVLELRSHVAGEYGLDDFTKDLSFSVDGDDLYVHMALNEGADRQGSVQIAGQLTAGNANRIETLRLLDQSGNVISGGDISLVHIANEAETVETRFTLTASSDAYGRIASPVLV